MCWNCVKIHTVQPALWTDYRLNNYNAAVSRPLKQIFEQQCGGNAPDL